MNHSIKANVAVAAADEGGLFLLSEMRRQIGLASGSADGEVEDYRVEIADVVHIYGTADD